MLHVYKILPSLNLRKKLDEVRGGKAREKKGKGEWGEEASLNMNMREERFTGRREGEEEEEERGRELSGRRAFPSSTHPQGRQETDPRDIVFLS